MHVAEAKNCRGVTALVEAWFAAVQIASALHARHIEAASFQLDEMTVERIEMKVFTSFSKVPARLMRHGLSTAATLLLGLVSHLAHAAEPTAADGTSMASLSLHSLNPEPRLYSPAYRSTSLGRVAPDSTAFSAWAPSRGPIQLFETQREFKPGQPQRIRPRLSLGFRSNALRNGLEHLGVDADTCMAPVFRLRGKLSSNGDVNSTFWISARCTFW